LNNTATNSTTGGACSDGSMPYTCLVDPCISATCLDGQVCESDYCGSCNAVCKKAAVPPHDDAPRLPAPTSCADGSAPVQCFVDPCATARCGDGLKCASNYCGGCTAECKP
jgi:hypothetical protein